MVQVIALIVAIVLVIALQQLRAILALPFPRYRWRPLASARPPAAWAALFDQAHIELKALGCEGPQWVLHEAVAGAGPEAPLRAIYRHRESACWLILSAVASAPFAHRLHATYTSRLRDGRILCSQSFDIWSSAMAGGELVGHALDAPDYAGQLLQHRRRLAEEGQGDPDWLISSALQELLVKWPEVRRQALLARGDLWPVNDDVATPSWSFAWRIRKILKQCPKTSDSGQLPPERLAQLVEQQRSMSERSPPARVQWALFGASTLLFVALGWLFWDLQFAVLLLAVIAFHESGHFLAMRAFGYRNVHMLMLPLIGGVAIGQDAQPNAWRRAWMSLMGPLPGILLGWALVALIWLQPALAEQWPWLTTLSGLLLFINYLNILPVPPLDGSHVVQSLLPHRLAWLQVGFVALAAVGGGLLAWWLGFPLLAALAALQLPALAGRWRLLQLAGRADAQLGGIDQPRHRLKYLCELVQRELPAAPAAQSILQVQALREVLDTRAMSRVQVALIGSLYAALAVVPVLAVVLLLGISPIPGNGDDDGNYAAMVAEQAALEAEAAGLPLAALLTDLEAEADAAGPASEAELQAAEARLGRRLPQELTAFFRLSNGLASASLAPVGEISTAAPVLETQLRAYDVEALWIWREDQEEPLEIPLDRLADWWWIGADFDGQTQLFYQPDPERSIDGMALISSFNEGSSGTASLRAYLEQSWVQQRLWRGQEERHRQALATQQEQLSDASVDELIELAVAEQKPDWSLSLLLWWFVGGVEEAPAGASQSALTTAQARVGPLPEDLQSIYRHADGLPWLGLGPLDAIGTLEQRAASYEVGLPNRLLAVMDACTSCDWRSPLPEAGALTAQFSSCLDLSPASPSADFRLPLPTLLWCAESTPRPGWYALRSAQRFGTATEALRAVVAQMRAAEVH